MRVVTCGKPLHDRIILLRGEIWAHKTLFKCMCQTRKVSGYDMCYVIDYASFYCSVNVVFFAFGLFQEKFENTKVVIRIRKSKDRQYKMYNEQKQLKEKQ